MYLYIYMFSINITSISYHNQNTTACVYELRVSENTLFTLNFTSLQTNGKTSITWHR